MNAGEPEFSAQRGITLSSGEGSTALGLLPFAPAVSALGGSLNFSMPDGERHALIIVGATSYLALASPGGPGSLHAVAAASGDSPSSETHMWVTEKVTERRFTVPVSGTKAPTIFTQRAAGGVGSPDPLNAALEAEARQTPQVDSGVATVMVKMSDVLKLGSVIVIIFSIFSVIGNAMSSVPVIHPLIPVILFVSGGTFFVMGVIYDGGGGGRDIGPSS